MGFLICFFDHFLFNLIRSLFFYFWFFIFLVLCCGLTGSIWLFLLYSSLGCECLKLFNVIFLERCSHSTNSSSFLVNRQRGPVRSISHVQHALCCWRICAYSVKSAKFVRQYPTFDTQVVEEWRMPAFRLSLFRPGKQLRSTAMRHQCASPSLAEATKFWIWDAGQDHGHCMLRGRNLD